jgi:hypothetical protein
VLEGDDSSAYYEGLTLMNRHFVSVRSLFFLWGVSLDVRCPPNTTGKMLECFPCKVKPHWGGEGGGGESQNKGPRTRH